MNEQESELFMTKQSEFYEKVLDRIDEKMSKIYSDMPGIVQTQLERVGLDSAHPINSQALFTKLRDSEELKKEIKKTLVIKYAIPVVVWSVITSFGLFYFVQQTMPLMIRKEITEVLKVKKNKKNP